MHTPLFEAIKKDNPNHEITVWLAPRGTQILAENNPNIDHVLSPKLKRPFLINFSTFQKISQQNFDISIMLSPGQQWKGATYMYLTGAKQRIAHQYPYLASHQSSFLLTDSIPEQEGLHDINQNLNLLEPLDIIRSKVPLYHLDIPSRHKEKGNQLFSNLNLSSTKTIIGIHPGSAPDFTWKRWSINNFAKTARHFIKNHDAHILIFGGPKEMKIKKSLRKEIGKKSCSIIDANLLDTSAVMQNCHAFISNDSGLMHLAAASGVKTYGLFGPTDENITGPRGADSHVIRAQETSPVYHTEKNYQLGGATHSTLLALTPKDVIQQIKL